MPLKGRVQRIIYGLGNFGKGFFYYSLGAYLTFFYVDIIGLKPESVAIALAIPYGVWNAVNDPLVGMISDRLKTPWGRRIPLIAVGAPITALLFWLIWSPKALVSDLNPATLFLALVIVLALFDLALTMVTAGYEALFPELFDDLGSRSEASLYRELFALLGVVTGFAIFPLLRSLLSPSFGTLNAWSYSALILSIVALASILASLRACFERAGAFASGAQPGLGESILLTLTNRAYLAFLGANVVVFFLWSWIPSMIPFYVKYVLNAGDEANALILGSMLLSAAAWWPILRKLVLKLGSKTSFTLSALVFILALQPLLFTTLVEHVAILMILVGAGNAGLQLVRMLLLSNVIDKEWIEKGYRREGTYIGTMIFFERLMYVVQGALLAVLLRSIGYTPDAPPTLQLTFGVRASVTLIPLACLIPLLASLAFYPIGKKEEELITKTSKELWSRQTMTDRS